MPPTDMVAHIAIVEDMEYELRSKYATTDDFNTLQHLTAIDKLQTADGGILESRTIILIVLCS